MRLSTRRQTHALVCLAIATQFHGAYAAAGAATVALNMLLTVSAARAIAVPGRGRPLKYLQPRAKDWDTLVNEQGWNTDQGDRRFTRMFRMARVDFDVLALAIRQRRGLPAPGADAQRRRGRHAAVSPELALAMTLRWLAGGSYLDIMCWANVLTATTFYRHVRVVLHDLDALLPPPSLERDLADPDRLAAVAAGFARRSYGHLKGIIGAIDGLLIPIQSPANAGAEGPRKFFTRKGFYAWNVQAVCDADARITHFSMIMPGSTHDSFAWQRDPLHTVVSRGGERYDQLVMAEHYLVGDEAYTTGETLATPWTARACRAASSARMADARMAYNYYHSAARITVERAFGQLTRRWMLLKRPYSGRIECTKHAPGLLLVLRVCVKLVRAERSPASSACLATARAHARVEMTSVDDACIMLSAQQGHRPRYIPQSGGSRSRHERQVRAWHAGGRAAAESSRQIRASSMARIHLQRGRGQGRLWHRWSHSLVPKGRQGVRFVSFRHGLSHADAVGPSPDG